MSLLLIQLLKFARVGCHELYQGFPFLFFCVAFEAQFDINILDWI